MIMRCSEVGLYILPEHVRARAEESRDFLETGEKNVKLKFK